MKKLFTCLFAFIITLLSAACNKHNPAPQPAPTVPDNTSLYFPPITGTDWQTTTAASLKWDETALNDLYPYLESQHTKAFIILKNGKIVAEKYFDKFTADSLWYWASAGKTITGLLIGIAQQESLININNPTSKYLGAGWTSEPLAKENLITIKNQLTMTTGLDDGVANNDCTLPGCLVYKADAGKRWAYHNAAYTILDKVIENASKQSFNTYFQQKIRDKTGMNGTWLKNATYNNVYYSNARSMARFGLLMLNKGKWDNTVLLADTAYFNSQVNTSQNLNLSYGYLTWLNGKSSSMVPQSQIVFPVGLIPNAPADMYAGLGSNDQKVYVVPSQKLVIIRMGNSAGGFSLAASGFDNELWGKLKTVIKY
ncbi:serine hydrolase domain-containing protein [Mucilaginibacter phyllosphaerae]|uniref:Class C beta-lactamase-related serine hydrolase n=1 Tax=Mucilaginibacter phyllosphaerae TaxID=1812349 RepID=A0A4Y8ABG2_9SPHI|nr:serine hydrolase [Mucilaginibacter phyllosphaerae]MBB3969355.1 CubicO group peptidase (beta-lactamase class C family) [Mucilaginibacter phyllosphaerae]TEW65855.1 class C beta-lactamase-related serine hydrolase [Mucilaginibacter phyllosphaerae]GGH07898.1 serine hydrolase [Mucilaginibacter phyllosphaerae]